MLLGWPRLVWLTGIAFVAVANLTLALALTESTPRVTLALAFVPFALLAGALLVTSEKRVLLAVALALPLFVPWGGPRQLAVGGANVFLADLVVLLSIGAWAFGRLAAAYLGIDRAPAPRTPVTGWPLVLFAGAIFAATFRGHEEYGTGLVSQPVRLVLYAAIALTLPGITPRALYRLLLWLFYTGTLVTTLALVYYVATGTSQTDQSALSTGGTRVLGISVTLYLAGALFLALLSLRLGSSARSRALHLSVASAALIGIALGFGRAVYLGVALVVLLVVALSGRVRRSILTMLPLVLPLLVAAALIVPLVVPDLVPSVTDRLSASPTRDTNVQWRVEANRVVLAQVREQPWIGVGFGRKSVFYVDVEGSNGFLYPVPQEIEQDPHNGYMWLLAGGGIAALGSFLLLVVVFAIDAVRRYRRTDDEISRLIVVWTGATLFAFLLNAASGTMFENTTDLLTIWTLLVLPAAVPLASRGSDSSVRPHLPGDG